MDGEPPGCILARVELSEATRANSIPCHADRMFSGKNDHNLNIVLRYQTVSLQRRSMKHVAKEGNRFVQTVWEKKVLACVLIL